MNNNLTDYLLNIFPMYLMQTRCRSSMWSLSSAHGESAIQRFCKFIRGCMYAVRMQQPGITLIDAKWRTKCSLTAVTELGSKFKGLSRSHGDEFQSAKATEASIRGSRGFHPRLSMDSSEFAREKIFSRVRACSEQPTNKRRFARNAC